MCGRFAITLPPEAVRAYFGYVEQPNFPPRANIAPTQPTPIVRVERRRDGELTRHFHLVRWGFLPAFVKDPKDYPLVVNARAETLSEKASFRNAVRRRRCLFVADAYYEWRRIPGQKGRGASTPFLIRRRDGAPLGLAGLWEAWMGPNGEEIETACTITTLANGALSAIHDRMPVIIERENFDRWLAIDDERDTRYEALMKPAADDVLEFFEIGTAVNKVANDGSWIQEPVAPTQRLTPKPAPADDPQGSLF
ncbi:MAG: putative response-associated peptidase [Hyphomicrobiales bacterium]|nr:putative response-associated peptidase [Hyphomicrobiales bacterium]